MKNLTEHPGAPDIESSTSNYARRFEGLIGQWFIDVQSCGTHKLLAKAGLLTPGLKVLDVGGGHGQNVNIMNTLGHKLTILGSDLSCKYLLTDALYNGAATFSVGDLKGLPFKDDEFDVVLCYRVMAHIDDWKMLVQELCRVSRSLVIVDFSSATSVNVFSDIFFNLKKTVEENTRYFRLHKVKDVVQAFTATGATPAFRYHQFFFPMAAHRALKCKGISILLEKISRVVGLTRLLGSPVLFSFKPARK